LGSNATIGEQVYDRSSKFRIQLGPMEIDLYRALLPGGARASELQSLVRLYAPDHLKYDVELNVPSDDLPTTELGSGGGRLGLTTSLGTPDEPVVSRVVEYE
jgi:type VI secretion system protein ImpH